MVGKIHSRRGRIKEFEGQRKRELRNPPGEETQGGKKWGKGKRKRGVWKGGV